VDTVTVGMMCIQQYKRGAIIVCWYHWS